MKPTYGVPPRDVRWWGAERAYVEGYQQALRELRSGPLVPRRPDGTVDDGARFQQLRTLVRATYKHFWGWQRGELPYEVFQRTLFAMELAAGAKPRNQAPACPPDAIPIAFAPRPGRRTG